MSVGGTSTPVRILIQKEPRDVEDVVPVPMAPVAGWPRCAGDCRVPEGTLVGDPHRPPLRRVEDYGNALAESTIRTMRTTLVLLDDPMQPTRVSMYDPIHDRVKKPGNLTPWLREQIWSGIQDFLSSGRDERGSSDVLYASRLQIAQVAGQQKKFDLRINCARCSLKYAPS